MIVHFSSVFLHDVQKMEGNTGYYRIRLGDYRMGFKMEAGAVVLMRCLHRRETDRYFP